MDSAIGKARQDRQSKQVCQQSQQSQDSEDATVGNAVTRSLKAEDKMGDRKDQ